MNWSDKINIYSCFYFFLNFSLFWFCRLILSFGVKLCRIFENLCVNLSQPILYKKLKNIYIYLNLLRLRTVLMDLRILACRGGYRGGRQDFCTPLKDSGGRSPPLRFQNSFSVALKGKKTSAKQEKYLS